MKLKNLRNYSPSQGGTDAKSSGMLNGQAVSRTKAESATNEMTEAYSQNAPKSNLGGKNTGS